jgi:hypothetical protein
MKKHLIIIAVCGLLNTVSVAGMPSLMKKESPKRMSYAEIQYMQLKESDVLISVNGYNITKEYVESYLSLMDELASFDKMKKHRKIDGKVKLYAIKKLLKELVIERVLTEYLISENLRPTAEEISKELTKIVKRYYPEFAAQTYRFYAKVSRDNRRMFETYVRKCATLEKAKHVIEGNIVISDEELNKAKEENIAYNVKARAALADVWNTASNDWNSVKASGDFDALVKKYEKGKNDHIYSDPEWGVFDLVFFKDDPEIIKTLNRMKKGDISEPVLGDFGLNILKLTDYEEFTDSTGMKDRRFHLAQIFYELPVIRSEDDGEIRADMIKKMKNKNYNTKLKELVDSAKITYPNALKFLN